MRLPAFVLLLFVATPAAAQVLTSLTFGVELRHRTEVDGRRDFEETGTSAFHLLRTRLSMSIAPATHISGFVQVQDARLWGEEDPVHWHSTLDGNLSGIGLHQLYFEIDRLFGASVRARIGRQELVYGNERLLGAADWRNSGRTFDAAVLGYRTERTNFDVFAAQLVDIPVRDAGERLYGSYATHRFHSAFVADAFVLFDANTENIQAGPDSGAMRLARFTPGVNLHGGAGRFEWIGEGAYQIGRIAAGDAPRRSIGAYLVSAACSVGFWREGRAGVSFTRHSGDADPSDDRWGAFDILFGTSHRFYGVMDYFPAFIGTRGLQDVAVQVHVQPARRFELDIEAHHFVEAAPHAKMLGQEVDFAGRFRPGKAWSMEAGVSLFRTAHAMQERIGRETGAWGYLLTQVTF